MSFGPQGQVLALAVSDGSVWLWHLPEDHVARHLAGWQERPLAVAFSPDGRLLAVGSEEGTAEVWQVAASRDGSWRATHLLTLQHGNWVVDLAFSPQGDTLATVALGNDVHLWKMPSGDQVDGRWLMRGDEMLRVAFSPDGRWLAAGTIRGAVALWELR